MLHRVQVTGTSQHQLFRGDCVKSGLHGWIAEKKPQLKDINKKKRLAWAKKYEQCTLDRWKSVLWSDEFKFVSNLCLCVTQSRWTDDLCMYDSPHEAWRRRCDGILLVTQSVIYLEFKAHLTSMATTAFCSDTPSHLFFFLVGLSFVFQQDNDPRLCKGYLTKNDGGLQQMTWPPQWWRAASDDLASTITRPQPIEMVWEELDHRVKEKQPKSDQHMRELPQDCWKSIPREASWENTKSVQSCHQGKGWLFWRI